MNFNIYFPMTFFLVLLSFPKQGVLPFLIFSGLFLDKVVYDLPFINTIILVILFVIAYSLPLKNKLKDKMIASFLFTSLYFALWSFLSDMLLLIPYFFNLIWNFCITIYLYQQDRLGIPRKR